MSNDAKDTPANVPVKSGCGCSSKPAAAENGKNAAGCCGGGGHDHAHDEHLVAAKAGVRDPVCGMTVDPALASIDPTIAAKPITSARKTAEPSSPPIPRNI
jgi:hypothetical protein